MPNFNEFLKIFFNFGANLGRAGGKYLINFFLTLKSKLAYLKYQSLNIIFEAKFQQILSIFDFRTNLGLATGQYLSVMLWFINQTSYTRSITKSLTNYIINFSKQFIIHYLVTISLPAISQYFFKKTGNVFDLSKIIFLLLFCFSSFSIFSSVKLSDISVNSSMSDLRLTKSNLLRKKMYQRVLSFLH